MTDDEARVKFGLAGKLFNEKQYDASFRALSELNREHPNQRNILFPMARCLAALNRRDEAIAIANRVAREFNFKPAAELYQRLQNEKVQAESNARRGPGGMPASTPAGVAAGPPPIPQVPAAVGGINFDSDLPGLPPDLDMMLDRPIVTGIGSPPASALASPEWRAYALWAVLILGGFAVMVAVSLTAARPAVEWQAKNQAMVARGEDPSGLDTPGGPLALYLLANLGFGYILSCLPAYWSLRIVHGLRFDSFGDDMKDVALWALYGILLACIPVIGWIFFLWALKGHFELNGSQLVVCVLLYFVLNVVASLVFLVPYNMIVTAAIS